MRWRLFRWRPRHWERRRSRLAAEYASCGSLWCNEEAAQGKRLVACTKCRQLGMQLATYVGSCDRERRHTGPQKPKEWVRMGGRGGARELLVTVRYCSLVSAGRPGEGEGVASAGALVARGAGATDAWPRWQARHTHTRSHRQRRTRRGWEYYCPRHDTVCDDGCFTSCLLISRGTICSRRPGSSSGSSSSGSSRA